MPEKNCLLLYGRYVQRWPRWSGGDRVQAGSVPAANGEVASAGSATGSKMREKDLPPAKGMVAPRDTGWAAMGR